jgi:hypothetical protein
MQKVLRCLTLTTFLLGTFVRAADIPATTSGNPEDFKIEITGSAWLLNSAGGIHDAGNTIDLNSDLAVQQQQLTFYGKFVFKPGRKHRIVVEGTPFRLSGNNNVSRSITYRGQTFVVNSMIRSSATLDYLFAGYQYDLFSGPVGHLGLSVGGSYLNATGTITEVQTSTVATKTETFGLPLAGLEFRVFPLPGHRWLEVDGGMRGMGLGGYGHYVEATGNGGFGLGPVTLQAGYRAVNADLHESSQLQNGIAVRLVGPIFSLVWKWGGEH